MSNARLPAVRSGPANAPALPSRVDAITDVMESLKALRTFVKGELKEGLDFGVIPGTGKKATLLLPGAQKIGLYFNVSPRFKVKRTELGGGHLEAYVQCTLVTRSTREEVSEGIGSCSTMESKYRTRNAARVCPACGLESIIKGKEDYGGGWVCFRKKGGCGAKFRDGDPAIEDQESGKVANDEIWDQRNTVLKMAKKRAQVDASLNLGAMSEMFTQDVEDLNVFDLRSPHGPPPADDRGGPKDHGREAVNAAFPLADRKGEERPPSPRRRPRQAPAEGWADWSSRTLQEAVDAWKNEQAVELSIPEAERTDLGVNAFRLTNHVVSAACEADHNGGPLVDESKVLGPNGKRDRDKTKRCADWLFANHRDWTVHEVASYLEGKRGRARQAAVDPDDFDLPEPGSDG